MSSPQSLRKITIVTNNANYALLASSLIITNTAIGFYKTVRNIVATSKWIIHENGGNDQGANYNPENAKLHEQVLFSETSNAVFAGINARIADAAGATMMLVATGLTNPLLSKAFAVQFALTTTAIVADYYGYYYEMTEIQPYKTRLNEIQEKTEVHQKCSSDDLLALNTFQENTENFKSGYVHVEYTARPLIELGLFFVKNSPVDLSIKSLAKLSEQFMSNAVGSAISWWKALLMHEVVTPKLTGELLDMTEATIHHCKSKDKTAEVFYNMTTLFLNDPTILSQISPAEHLHPFCFLPESIQIEDTCKIPFLNGAVEGLDREEL